MAVCVSSDIITCDKITQAIWNNEDRKPLWFVRPGINPIQNPTRDYTQPNTVFSATARASTN